MWISYGRKITKLCTRTNDRYNNSAALLVLRPRPPGARTHARMHANMHASIHAHEQLSNRIPI